MKIWLAVMIPMLSFLALYGQIRAEGGAASPAKRVLKPEQNARGCFDSKPKPYTDLMPSYRVVRDAENAVPLLLKADQKIQNWREISKERRAYMVKGGKWKAEFWNKALSENTEVLELHRQAIQKKYLQIDAPVKIDTITVGLMSALKVVTLQELQLIRALKNNRIPNAMVHLKQSFRFSQMCMESDGGLIGWLVAVACYERSLSMADEILDHRQCDLTTVKEIEKILTHSPNIEQRFQEAFRFEFLMSYNLFAMIHNEGLDALQLADFRAVDPNAPKLKVMMMKTLTKFFFQPNRTIHMHANLSRHTIKMAALPHWRRKQVAEPVEFKNLERGLTPFTWLSTNAFGRILFKLAAPLTRKQIDKIDYLRSSFHLVRLKCALRHYYLVHQALPAQLEALVPQFTKSIPSDDFDGKTLRYSQKKRRIWSVGRDAKDEGGLEEPIKLSQIFKMRNEPTLHLRFVES